MKKLTLNQLEGFGGGFCDPHIQGICINDCIAYYLLDSALFIYNTHTVGFPPNYCN
jgi:hypothetical protein